MSKDKNVEDLDNDYYPENSDSFITKNKTVVYDYRIHVGDMDGIENHLSRINTIRDAGPDDTIELTITTPGGDMDVMLSYVDAIANTQAQVLARAVGQVSSAGTVVWGLAHNREASRFSSFMFHNVQAWAEGDGAIMKSKIDFLLPHVEKILREAYKEILTEGEFKKIFGGDQLWLTGEEVINRISNYRGEQDK